jgi:hypothetical protein
MMSGFWTLKLSKNNKDEQPAVKGNGRNGRNGHNGHNGNDPDKLVHLLMTRALDDAQSIVSLITMKAQREAEMAMTGDIDRTETDITEQSGLTAEKEPETVNEQLEETRATTGDSPAEPVNAGHGTEELIADAVEMDKSTLYSEDIELVINSPIEPAALSKLYNSLQMTPEIKILYTNGSWEKGTVITISLEKPLPLLEIISGIQGLKVTTGKRPIPGTVQGITRWGKEGNKENRL